MAHYSIPGRNIKYDNQKSAIHGKILSARERRVRSGEGDAWFLTASVDARDRPDRFARILGLEGGTSSEPLRIVFSREPDFSGEAHRPWTDGTSAIDGPFASPAPSRRGRTLHAPR